MFEIEIALTPNKNATIIFGKFRKIPNKANVGAMHTEQMFIMDRIVAPIVEDTIDVSLAPNFSFKIEKIIEMTKKIVIREAGIIKSQWGGNSCVIFSPLSVYLPTYLLDFPSVMRDA